MLLWAVDNGAPANYLLISDDRDFSDVLQQLRLRRYNIFLAKNLLTDEFLENPHHKTNLKNKQQKNIDFNGNNENVTALKKAPHEYFKVASSRSTHNKQIIPLGKIHRNRSSFSNDRAPTVISSPVEHGDDLVGIILLALDRLREEKVIPTHVNIVDCIRCCYGGSTVDINKGLQNALKQLMIVKISLGSFELFVVRGQRLWKCINPIGGNTKDYPETTWDRIRRFLSSSRRCMIYTSNTRSVYQYLTLYISHFEKSSNLIYCGQYKFYLIHIFMGKLPK